MAIENPQEVADWQRSICTLFGYKGRIIVATEGINVTVGGPVAAVESYKNFRSSPLLVILILKESKGDERYFP